MKNIIFILTIVVAVLSSCSNNKNAENLKHLGYATSEHGIELSMYRDTVTGAFVVKAQDIDFSVYDCIYKSSIHVEENYEGEQLVSRSVCEDPNENTVTYSVNLSGCSFVAKGTTIDSKAFGDQKGVELISATERESTGLTKVRVVNVDYKFQKNAIDQGTRAKIEYEYEFTLEFVFENGYCFREQVEVHNVSFEVI